MGKKKNKKVLKISCFLLPFFYFLFILSINVFSQTENLSIDDRLQNIFDKYNMVSMSIVVFKDANVIYRNTFGYQNLETKKKTEADTHFRVASLSKLYTASLIYKLKKMSLLKFDDNIEKYLGYNVRNPDFPEDIITIRHLLDHTSTINESNGRYIEFIKESIAKKLSLKEFLNKDGEYYSKKNFLQNISPGHKHNYSNLGYIILGTIAEKITGKRFDVLIKEMILDFDGSGDFNPERIPIDRLGTTYSYMNDFHFPEVDNVVKPESIKGITDGYKIGENALLLSPQSGLRINLNGLENSVNYLLKYEKIFNIEDIKYMKKHRVKTKVKNLYQLPGMMMSYNIFKDTELIGHSGSSFGITSDLYFNPERKIGFAIITNGAKLGKLNSQWYMHQREIFDVIVSILENME